MNKFVIFLIIVTVLVIIFAVFGSKIPLLRELHNKAFGGMFQSTYNSPHINTEQEIPVQNDWCVEQEIRTENVIRDRILGWDDKDSCCVRMVEGFDCALNKTAELEYCYTAEIGGKMKYAKINNYHLANPYNYKVVLDNIQKEYIENKPCDNSLYPWQVR